MVANSTLIAEIPNQFGIAIRVFSDGTIERPFNSPIVPPTLHDPQTGVSSKDLVISHDPLVSLRLYLPKLDDNQKVPIFVYFHGGAFYFESAFSRVYHSHCNTFASQAKVIIASVEYRLAPEHSLPACYHDCWEALKWVASHFGENATHAEPWLTENGDFSRVFVGGNSAGANIAHNMVVRAGSEDLPNGVKIHGAVITHPFFHSSSLVGAETLKGEENISYLIWNFVYPSAPDGVDNPLFNPVGPALDEIGCSKIIVCVAGKDRLRERGIWYHEGLKNSGWQGNLELFEETDEGHDYQLLKPDTENATKLIKRLLSFFQE
ncbi:2-hydroxyisoflavanone dehydratase [Cajanus cajan]|uniref:Gibberellin receptor GID1L2 n=1 Tax=Cajanus cajan TaxID=3821 RepID=A0A151U6Y7_CAJCA|nr:2-hydroxyisoflavanone dehydratase [Cajanus cajan]KYP75054.1 putative gibberellin receptor GID1L2 [Cajanus cajan]